MTAYALATERIGVGTGVVPLYTRTPATMAQTAATIDELSGGRLTLGLGVSHRLVVEGWHGQTIDHPVDEMREYVAIVRAILRGKDPPAGTKWRSSFRLVGLDPRPDLPIFVAALPPNMMQLAGEIADGVMLWLCNPDYVREVVSSSTFPILFTLVKNHLVKEQIDPGPEPAPTLETTDRRSIGLAVPLDTTFYVRLHKSSSLPL